MRVSYWRRDWLFWVVLGWGLLASIAIARAGTPDIKLPRDPWGNMYPVECRQDLRWLNVPIVREDLMGSGKITGSGRQLGYWWRSFKTNTSTIYVDISVTDQVEYANVVQHELCHERMYRLTGNPTWHKGE